MIRIDSPGGSALASERIRTAIVAARAKGLPVVVSMGNVAASGGYWIATAGSKIYAEPSTITGSIGVFGILPSFQGTMDKLGLGADGVKTTPLSGEPDLLRGPSPEVSRLLQTGVESTYNRFLTLVAQSRRMTPQRVDQIAQGRIWDGGTARQLGLVDAFGGLDEAVAEAARLAKLDPDAAKAVWIEKEPDFFDAFFASMGNDDKEEQAGDVFGRAAQRPQMLLAQAMAEADRLLGGAAIQARCIECAAHAEPPRPAPANGLTAWLLRLIGA